MGRLIDAEQTKLMLSELLEVANKENFTAEDVISHACEWVDNLPTAYDVEKVVESIKTFAECNEECKKNFYYGQGCGACVWNKIMEIVRKGGVE